MTHNKKDMAGQEGECPKISKSDIAQTRLDVLLAATSDVHVLQSVLTLSDNFCPSHRTREWQVHPEARRTGIACDLNHANLTETIENLRKW
jgi:hypothetical protein